MKNKKKILICISLIVGLCLMQFISAGSSLVGISEISPNTLIPGEEAEITFQIENTGDVDIENLIFSWTEKSGSILPIGMSNTKNIGMLEGDDGEEIEFSVFTSSSAEPNLYELTFILSFKQGNTTITETSNAGIIVGGQTDFEISLSDYSTDGLLISVSNIGKNPADSVTVVIPEQTGIKITGSSSSVIGNLEKGDYSIASFEATKTAGGSNTINVEIYYTDTKGTRQKITKTIEMPQSTASTSLTSDIPTTTSQFNQKNAQSTNGTNYILISLFVITTIIIITIIYVIIKKRKNQDEDI
ncbi:MAG: hypothetical protein WC755_07590 [Candidatus Woesearchaeota archaeon]|jgi:hypothetical protein